MKRTLNFLWILLAATAVFTSCNGDDPKKDNPVLTEDGMYIVGEATAWTEANPNGVMVPGINEANNSTVREGMYEKYVAIEAGKTFNIVEVAGASQISYGPGEMSEKDLTGIAEHPQVTVTYGTYSNSGSFTVANSGMYHIVLDKQLGKVFIIPVTYWGVLGGASDYGWSDDATHMMPGNFDKNTMTFSLDNVILRNGKAYKFRHGGGWKVGLVSFDKDLDEVRVNTNFGGAIDALVPGGADITLNQPEGKDGTYTVNMTWKADMSGYGFEASLTNFAEVEPLPEYGDMYLVGAGTAYGWTGPGDASHNGNDIMHQCANSQDGLYWKILKLTANTGFKISAASWGDPNLGAAQITEVDPEGIAVTADGDGNMTVAETGMYVVALDLRDGIKLSIKPAEVYGIGGTFGDDSWTGTTAFTYNAATESFVSPAISADGNVRMYAKVPWNSDWWAAEFNVFGTNIVYRNTGGDQDAVAVTAGQVVTLHFDDNTGSIQ